MTPKERAIELVNKFRIKVGTYIGEEGEECGNYLSARHVAKRAAIICCDEIIEVAIGSYDEEMKIWWESVKQEIEKL